MPMSSKFDDSNLEALKKYLLSKGSNLRMENSLMWPNYLVGEFVGNPPMTMYSMPVDVEFAIDCWATNSMRSLALMMAYLHFPIFHCIDCFFADFSWSELAVIDHA